MRSFALGAVLVVAGLGGSVGAQTWEAPGSLVGVSVEVEGRSTPLYAAVDGSGRYYVEARAGARYTIRLASRTRERVGVLVTVDGLNVVSGERVADLSSRPSGLAGRLYVLDPWGETTIRGWRTSLDDVRRFTFVDEKASYAARAGKSNSKMGWIEVAVFRERRPYVWRQPYDRIGEPREESRDKSEYEGPGTDAGAAGRADSDAPKARSSAPPLAAESAPRERSYPGTGWGSRVDDRAVVVDFEPETTPSERHTLRYEYASALYALGVLPRPYPPYRDRLGERDRGEGGFVRPPAW